MPKVSVNVPHQGDPREVVEKIRPSIEKMIRDFEGRDMDITWQDTEAQFSFKSLAFTIQGTATVLPDRIQVEVNLPLAAMMFKDRVEKALSKNLTKALQDS